MTNIIELPKELWLEIVFRLDYFDLKRCMRVSKTFKAFTEKAALNDVLFRSEAVVPAYGIIDPTRTRLHPAFDRGCFGCATSIDKAYSFTNNYNDQVLLTNTIAAKEHATNPPVSVLRFQIHSWTPVEVKNKNGVTVSQVMKALCRFFDEGDHRKAMYDHTGWTGWDRKVLDSSGRLVLKVMWFDS